MTAELHVTPPPPTMYPGVHHPSIAAHVPRAMVSADVLVIMTDEGNDPHNERSPTTMDSGMTGKFVIVRCRDAGVHAGVLRGHEGREATLDESRRLWFWRAAEGDFLSGVAVHGLDSTSKIGAPITVHLTETSEIIECSPTAEASIRAMASHRE